MANTSPQPPPTFVLADLVSELRADAAAAFEAKQTGNPRGPQTGLTSLDEALGKYLAPGLHVLQAAPGAGKTAMGLQIASDCSFPALFVSAEMPTLELFRRLIARKTSTFLGKLKSGEMKPDLVASLAVKTAGELAHLSLTDGTMAYASPEIIRDVAEGLRDKNKSPHALIVIDSLQVWARSVRDRNGDKIPVSDYDAINAAIGGANEIAAMTKCPVLLIAHRNRAGQKDGGMHAAKGTGDIEYAVETLIDLEPEKDARPDQEGEIPITARLVKNRHGVAGAHINLKFSGRLQSFRSV